MTYIYPDQLTIPNQVQKIEEAIAAQADGIAICVFTEDAAYADVVARAKEAGIAVGSAAAPPSGAHGRAIPNDMFLFRTGSDEGVAGRLTAQRLLRWASRAGSSSPTSSPATPAAAARHVADRRR